MDTILHNFLKFPSETHFETLNEAARVLLLQHYENESNAETQRTESLRSSQPIPREVLSDLENHLSRSSDSGEDDLKDSMIGPNTISTAATPVAISCQYDTLRIKMEEALSSIGSKTSVDTMGDCIALEGGIGMGKSTMGKLLVALAASIGQQVFFFEEPSNQTELLAFISDQKNKAKDFQLLMLKYRVMVLRLAVILIKAGCSVILDRTLYGDRVFEYQNWVQGNIDDEGHAEYLQAYAEASHEYEQLCALATVIYIPKTLAESDKLIKKRDREGENRYPPEYLASIIDTYAKYQSVIEASTAGKSVVLKDGWTHRFPSLWKVKELENPIVPELWAADNAEVRLNQVMCNFKCGVYNIQLDEIGGSLTMHSSISTQSPEYAVALGATSGMEFCHAAGVSVLTNSLETVQFWDCPVIKSFFEISCRRAYNKRIEPLVS